MIAYRTVFVPSYVIQVQGSRAAVVDHPDPTEEMTGGLSRTQLFTRDAMQLTLNRSSCIDSSTIPSIVSKDLHWESLLRQSWLDINNRSDGAASKDALRKQISYVASAAPISPCSNCEISLPG